MLEGSSENEVEAWPVQDGTEGVNDKKLPAKRGHLERGVRFKEVFHDDDGTASHGTVGQLVYPKQDEGTFHNEWHRRKDEFKDADAWERLAMLQTFFWQNHARVLETLQSGIPFYAKWESVGNEGQEAPLS